MAAQGAERQRLAEERDRGVPWKKWGPYLSDRQWGTVREDYSRSGDAWNYFTHDQARSRAYRWGEDGLGGISDDQQLLCLALALWNGKDAIIKERLFGLTNHEGNHGEDVKECYFYLDNTPTHSYMTFLYKYPQSAFPYLDLIEANRRRGKGETEFELLDTGIFDDDKYFDVLVEYAKAAPENILIKINVANRAAVAATLHLLPTLWFRNTWSWEADAVRPRLRRHAPTSGHRAIAADHAALGEYVLYCEGAPDLLFTDNETNRRRLFGEPNPTPFVKDAINDYVTLGATEAVNPALSGTKASAHYLLTIPPGEVREVRLRLASAPISGRAGPFGAAFERILGERRNEANAFYGELIPSGVSEDETKVIRQALAGMLWNKQFFNYDVDTWLREHGCDPQRKPVSAIRNRNWYHMHNADIVAMPDKWEYPWYAAWDLAFQAVPLCLVDPEFAKGQLELMLREDYLHPTGQLPASEWDFGDVNPPVHAWAALAVFSFDSGLRGGKADIEFLKHIFQKLLLNFTWWVNRQDPKGNNIFSGGFVGLDSMGLFDRSVPLASGILEQSDGIAWMAFYSAQMLRIAIELARYEPLYEEMALKFFEHFLWIASAMDRLGEHDHELWDNEDGFFYGVLHLPNGKAARLKVRSIVGLLPLAASVTIPAEVIDRCPALVAKARLFFEKHPDAMKSLVSPVLPGVNGRRLVAILDERKLRRILAYMLDEDELLSPYGIRSLSRAHKDRPYTFSAGATTYRVDYEAGESTSDLVGGNSHWRGPIWFPANALIIRGLLQHYLYYGDGLKVECPTGSGQSRTLFEVAVEICRRMTSVFLRDSNGKRPVHDDREIFRTNPHWQDLLLFYEYFNGDTGAGMGASHQTGWTGLVAALTHFAKTTTAETFLRSGGEWGTEAIFIDPKRRRRSAL